MVSTTTTSSAQPSKPIQTDVPVLIVGAGPTGLFAALLLAKMGIPCRLIERQHGVSTLSKALVLHARTLEIFQMVGSDMATTHQGDPAKRENPLLEKFLASGARKSEFYMYFGHTLSTKVPTLKNKESHFNFGLFLEQSKTVAILTEELEKLGMQIDRGWELMDTKVVKDEKTGKQYVETTIRRAKVGTNIRSTESKILGAVELEAEQEGKEYELEVVKSEYLIAADGGKSVVRHKLNIPFQGRTRENQLVLFDGHIKCDIPLDQFVVIHGDVGRPLVSIPLGDGRVRVMINNGTKTAEEHARCKSEDLTLEKFQEMVDKTAYPVKMELLDCDWLTYYRVNERLAERYTHEGRIFLSGDAAHVHSPAGGQGLNMGLQDAFNLTWKMALVLKGSAPSSILDTYEVERPKVAADIIQLSSNIFGNGISDSFIHRMLRRVVLHALTYILPRIPHGPPMCMLRIRYHENAINKVHPTQPLPPDEFKVGARARDGFLSVIGNDGYEVAVPGTAVELSDHEDKEDPTLRLHHLLVGPGVFHIIVFTSDMLHPKNIRSGTTIKGVLAQDIGKEVEDHLVTWQARYTPSSLSVSVDNNNTHINVKANHQGKMFMVHVISATAVDAAAASGLATKSHGEGRLYLDKDGVLHEKYGVAAAGGPGSIFVLRPDSYVGYRVMGAGRPAWQDVDDYLSSILTSIA
ncbi:MAG: FAD binding domain-containing protein [Benniella sp.]|nr:MAG: FAD binding domain-containing protein [Benniella sp.]